MKDKITLTEFGRREYAEGGDSLTRGKDARDENVNKVFSLDDDALNFSSLDYYHFSNYIQSSKSFEAVLKSDLKRIENFKEKFNLEKFNQRSKKYKKLVDYWHKSHSERFIDLMETYKKKISFPSRKVSKDSGVDFTAFNDNMAIVGSYIFSLRSTAFGKYCFDKYFDRFNFNYDIDIKAIKGEIDEEIIKVFMFNIFLQGALLGNISIKLSRNLKKYFRGGRQLSRTKKTNYKMVAEYITIMEKHFKKLTGKQRIACELAEVNQYSFSAWKNAKNKAGRKSNADKILWWKEEKIPSEKVEELKTDLANYLKSS